MGNDERRAFTHLPLCIEFAEHSTSLLLGRVTQEWVCILCRVWEQRSGELRNQCNAASCLLRHSCTMLDFQDAGNCRVVINANAWEHLCGQAVGKGDPEEVFEKFQIFQRSPEKFLCLVISTLLSLPSHSPWGREQHVVLWASQGACLVVLRYALLWSASAGQQGLSACCDGATTLTCAHQSPQTAAAWVLWLPLELLHQAVETKCCWGHLHHRECPPGHSRPWLCVLTGSYLLLL